MRFGTRKSDRGPGTGQVRSVLAMVAAGLGAVTLVGGAAALVSAADASPLVVAAVATLTAVTVGCLLALASNKTHKQRAESQGHDERTTSNELRGKIRLVEANGQELAFLDLGREVGPALRRQLDETHLDTGKPFRSGGPLTPECLLAAGVVPAIERQLRAGNLFVLSDPAGLLKHGSLMKLGKGFAAAVHGPQGKIAGSVRFVPAAANLAIAAPVLLLTVFSTVMTTVRFERIETALRRLSSALNLVIKDKLSEDLARFLSASERLSDIHAEYLSGSSFTGEMKMRLALVERDTSILRNKYHALATAEVNSVFAAKLSENDKRLFVAASIADVQVDQLRLVLALQDNPADAARRLSALQEKADSYESDFHSLAENDPVKQFKEDLQRTIDEMGLLKKLSGRRKAIRAKIDTLEDAVRAGRPDDPADAEEPVGSAARQYSILMWRDDDGAGELRAWYTNDFGLAELAEPDPSPAADGPDNQAAAV